MNSDALRGHLDALILSALEPEPLHGYAVIEALARRSGGSLDVPTGTLYPALRRLERSGCLRSKWTTVGGRRRRTYQLTAAGRRSLAAERSDWVAFSTAIDRVMKPATGRA